MNPRRPGFTPVRGRFWRMLAPRWVTEPLSGAGAQKHGGRYNSPGQSALYMSADFATAVSEYEQELGIRPGMLCAYDVDCPRTIDLTSARIRESLGVDESLLRIPWKHLWLVARRTPPTWILTNRILALGAQAIRVPSTRSAGANLVLFRWNERGAASVLALDPLGELPRPKRPRKT